LAVRCARALLNWFAVLCRNCWSKQRRT